MTQTEQVLSHIMEYGSITQLEAMEEFGIMRLGARIWDLRAAGVPIVTETETKKNRYGKPVSYAKYMIDFEKMMEERNAE